MPTSCIAVGCFNKGKIQGITYHSFPANLKQRQKWIDAIRRKDWEPKHHSRICSSHFREVDVDRTSLSVVRIREGAVPSIFPAVPQETRLKKLRPLKRESFDGESCSDLPPQGDLCVGVPGGAVCTSFGKYVKEVKEEPYVEENSCNLEIDRYETSPALMNVKEEPTELEEGENLEPIDLVSVSLVKEEFEEEFKVEPEDEDKLQPFDFVSVEEEDLEEKAEVILGGPTFDDLHVDGGHEPSLSECYEGEENEVPAYPSVCLEQEMTGSGTSVDMGYAAPSAWESDKPFQCEVCPSRFRKQWNLKQHMLKHSGARPYACDVCGKCFSDSSVLKKHKRIHSGEKPYACTVCDKKFIQKCSLNKHLSFHKEKPFTCDLCSRSFATLSKMDYHRRVHTEVKPFKCDVCGAEFRQSHNLSKHKHIHNKEKPYQCEDCHKSFSQSYNLKTHRQVHTGEKPFVCGFCDAAFRVKEKLIIHERKHTGEKPYPCDVCGKAFSILTSYKVHMRTHNDAKT